MIKPDFSNYDDALEYAARLIEEISFADLGGIAARRKRDREDAALRVQTTKEVRAECARHIRAFIGRPDLSPVAKLREIAALDPEKDHVWSVRDAWGLAKKGWLKIELRIVISDNTIPPTMSYRIVLTDRGRAKLAETPP